MAKTKFNKLKSLFFELLVVFVGVYLAFQLNNFKEEKTNDETKNNYYNVLLAEFEANLIEIQQTKSRLQKVVDKLDKGTKADLFSLRKLDIKNNLFLLQSAFNSGYLENIDSQYIKNISNGSNHLARVASAIDNYNAAVRDVLITNDFDESIFYENDNSLKTNYSWCKDDLNYIIYYLSNLEKGITDGAIPQTKLLIK